jgi:hypothetical protein
MVWDTILLVAHLIFMIQSATDLGKILASYLQLHTYLVCKFMEIIEEFCCHMLFLQNSDRKS